MAGAFLAFYAFIGFEDMVNVAEEAKNPRRSMPIAIVAALVLATIIYMLVVLVSIAAVPPDELAGSTAPLSLVLSKVSSLNPSIISVIGLAAALNGIIVQLIMGSRMLYGLAAQGWIPQRFATVHPRYNTPVLATLVISAVMIFGVMVLPLVALAQLTSYLVLAIFILVNLALIVIKRRKAALHGVLSVPLALPVLGALSSLGVILYEIVL